MTLPSTFSIVGADPEAGECGVAVQSRFLAAGALVPWATGGVGALATQAFVNVGYGPEGLRLLAGGRSPAEVVEALVGPDPERDHRQLGVVSAAGESAAFTGPACFDHAGHLTGPGYAVQGNILAGPEVVEAMAEAFTNSSGSLADRLVAALSAGQEAGGDRRGQESAAVVVVKPGGGYGGTTDKVIDLRVDHHDQPIAELARLLDLHDLYFGKSPPESWVPLDDTLRDEIGRRLQAAGRWPEEADLADALYAYMGWENLEDRWIDRHHIDPRVLEYLQERLA